MIVLHCLGGQITDANEIFTGDLGSCFVICADRQLNPVPCKDFFFWEKQ
jgi:hypothetical protein